MKLWFKGSSEKPNPLGLRLTVAVALLVSLFVQRVTAGRT
jgi:hypothetical protein